MQILKDMWNSLDLRGRYIMMIVGAALIVFSVLYGFSDVLLGLL